jgi:hypothetical protein
MGKFTPPLPLPPLHGKAFCLIKDRDNFACICSELKSVLGFRVYTANLTRMSKKFLASQAMTTANYNYKLQL